MVAVIMSLMVLVPPHASATIGGGTVLYFGYENNELINQVYELGVITAAGVSPSVQVCQFDVALSGKVKARSAQVDLAGGEADAINKALSHDQAQRPVVGASSKLLVGADKYVYLDDHVLCHATEYHGESGKDGRRPSCMAFGPLEKIVDRALATQSASVAAVRECARHSEKLWRHAKSANETRLTRYTSEFLYYAGWRPGEEDLKDGGSEYLSTLFLDDKENQGRYFSAFLDPKANRNIVPVLIALWNAAEEDCGLLLREDIWNKVQQHKVRALDKADSTTKVVFDGLERLHDDISEKAKRKGR